MYSDNVDIVASIVSKQLFKVKCCLLLLLQASQILLPRLLWMVQGNATLQTL